MQRSYLHSTMADMITKKKARCLWDALKAGFILDEARIREIISLRAWEPLGYGGFTQAWAAEMRNITLAKEVRPQVAFQMFQEGANPEDVASDVKGIGDRRAKEWHGEWADGVPAEGFNRGHIKFDQTIVKSHTRNKPSRPAYVRFAVGSTWYEEYKRVAVEMGTTVEAVARAATERAFRELAAKQSKKRLRRA